MAYLGEIVGVINEGLKAKLTAFPLTEYSGIVYPIPRKKVMALSTCPRRYHYQVMLSGSPLMM